METTALLAGRTVAVFVCLVLEAVTSRALSARTSTTIFARNEDPYRPLLAVLKSNPPNGSAASSPDVKIYAEDPLWESKVCIAQRTCIIQSLSYVCTYSSTGIKYKRVHSTRQQYHSSGYIASMVNWATFLFFFKHGARDTTWAFVVHSIPASLA